jgi:hypothetical protein
MLFGSDYPPIAPDRLLASSEKPPIRDEVRPEGAQGQRGPTASPRWRPVT